MTVEELEGKLTNIYHEFAETISENETDEDNCTVEERKALNEYYEYRRHNFHNLSYYYVSSDIKFANLAVGDDFYDDEIIAIDKKLGIVVTKDGNEINYYWIKDPNSKPSLYRRGAYNSLVL